MGQLQIFLADDHTMVRTGLRALINSEPDMHVVGEASDAANSVAGRVAAGGAGLRGRNARASSPKATRGPS